MDVFSLPKDKKRKNEVRKPDKNSGVRRLKFMPRSLDLQEEFHLKQGQKKKFHIYF
jgi:hypothetical protein